MGCCLPLPLSRLAFVFWLWICDIDLLTINEKVLYLCHLHYQLPTSLHSQIVANPFVLKVMVGFFPLAQADENPGPSYA